ncbi:hypothetical protein PCANC_11247 [Puccinia coronata f. sp. avenae]|uniref:Uncharacterized protein n=1 Tax=Puccinia coronata f. sp. avenae TaxID=200324 RepID=A0A2N5T695_9BASI|nr:hypothetical protein PCANC_11247 [Puccinia coronata f. sp. avenae]
MIRLEKYLVAANQSHGTTGLVLRTFFPVTHLVWDINLFGNALYVITAPIESCGNMLSLVWCNQLSVLYLGCQDTSIQVRTSLKIPASPNVVGALGLSTRFWDDVIIMSHLCLTVQSSCC